MEEVKRIYMLLLRSNGLKIRDIASVLELDSYHVADVMFSASNMPYWYQSEESLWYAKDGAIQIEDKAEKPKEDASDYNLKRPKSVKIERFLKGKVSDSLYSYIKGFSNYRTLSDKEIHDLFIRYRNGDRKAYDQIVKSHLKLVAGIALLYKKEGVSLEDLIQEGNMGLLKAIERFDHEKYSNFLVYAKSWISQSISLSLNTLPYSVRLPLNQMSLYKKVRKEIEKFEHKNEYTPSVSEIEVEWDSDVDPDNMSLICNLPDDLSNLTTNPDNWDDYPSSDFLPDGSIERESQNTYFNEALASSLNERELQIVRAYWGLDNEKESLSSIAERFYLTRERVRQIAWKAISNLKDVSLFKKFLYFGGKKRQIKNDKKEDIVDAKEEQTGTWLLGQVIKDYDIIGSKERLGVNTSRKWDRDLYKDPPKKMLEKENSDEINQEMDEYCDNISDYNEINDDTIGTEETSSNDVGFSDDSNLSKDIIFSVFRNTSSTYKYYWLISILQIFQQTNSAHIYIYDILARMVANAWYPINCHHIFFGGSDSLSNIISVIKEKINYPDYADLEIIYDEIKSNQEDECIKNQLQRLIKYVPYRFLSPWIKSISYEECETLSQQYKGDCLYALLLQTEKPFIIINPSWESYLRENLDDLIEFSFDELSRFLQYRNPCIKDLRDKIEFHRNSQDYINEITNEPSIDNTIETSGNFSYIYNQERKVLYSSSGRILKNANSFYRINFTYSNISINIIDKTNDGRYVTGKRIINAGYRSLLYKKIDKSDFFDKIEEIKQMDGKWCIKVNGVWYGDYGGVISLNNSHNSHVNQRNNSEEFSNTLEETLFYFQKGCSPETISTTRQLALSTVYGHLAQLVKLGLVNVYDLISEKDVSLVRKAIENVGANQLSAIRNYLHKNISYDIIKLAIAQIQRES